MKKQVRLYNMIFPIWALYLFPLGWLVVLPANFIIDSLVFIGAMTVFKITDRKEKYLKCILRIWLYGFLADLIASALLFLALAFEYIDYGIALDPLRSLEAFAFTSVGVVLAGVCIFLFNYKKVLPLVLSDERERKKLALTLAILTAPYAMYIPATLFY